MAAIGTGPFRGAVRVAALAALLMLVGCDTHGSSFIHPHGTVAEHQRRWLFETLGLMSIVVLPAILLAPLFAWRYRYGGSRRPYRPDWSFSTRLEFLVWGVPILIVGALSWFVWVPELRFDPYRRVASNGTPLTIDVVALNWKWLFIYPEQHIATVGTMALPVGRNVTFELTSDRTMQSFLIPTLGSQIYAMAGMVTKLNLVASDAGDFMGENTQFNGNGFQRDRFSALAMTPSDFSGWVQAVRASPLKLDRAAYGVLFEDSTASQARQELRATAGPANALYFASVPDGFFRAIVDKYQQPRPSGAKPMRS